MDTQHTPAVVSGLTEPAMGVRSGDIPMDEGSRHARMAMVAAQLIEGARRARDGDREATRRHIARAISLLRGTPNFSRGRLIPRSAASATAARGGLPAWQMRRIAAYVEAHLSRRIRVQELARLLGLSASHFCRAFKSTSGAAPRDYVLHRRIEVAQGLMLTTSEPLSAIAVACGMCDQPHFTRCFASHRRRDPQCLAP